MAVSGVDCNWCDGSQMPTDRAAWEASAFASLNRTGNE